MIIYHCKQCNDEIKIIYTGMPCDFNDLVNGNYRRAIERTSQYCEGCKIFARTGRWLSGFGPVPAAVQKCIDEGTRGLA